MENNPQESLENPLNTMGTLLGVHPIVPWMIHRFIHLIRPGAGFGWHLPCSTAWPCGGLGGLPAVGLACAFGTSPGILRPGPSLVGFLKDVKWNHWNECCLILFLFLLEWCLVIQMFHNYVIQFCKLPLQKLKNEVGTWRSYKGHDVDSLPPCSPSSSGEEGHCIDH